MNMGISLSALPATPEEATKIIEVLSRTAAGLGLEGISCALNINSFDDEEEDGTDNE
jgi:hypothetical protein